MKSIILGFLILVSINLNAQMMNSPKEVVIKLFIAADQQDWSQVEASFNPKVTLDYSSMNGSPAKEFHPSEITASWKGILPGFSSTHHQLGNFQSSINDGVAHVFCYGTASHYLDDENGNVWVVVGSYDFDLTLSKDGSWKISSMKFNYKYQDGNISLPEKAINNLK